MPLSLAAQVSEYPWDHSRRMPYCEFTKRKLTAEVLIDVMKETSFKVSELITALIVKQGIAYTYTELLSRIVDLGLEGNLKLTILQIRVLLQAIPLLARGQQSSKLVIDFYEECYRKWPSEDHDDHIISIGEENQNAVLMELQEFIIFLNRAKLDYDALRYQQLMAPYVEKEKEAEQAEQAEQAKKAATSKKKRKRSTTVLQPRRWSSRTKKKRVFLMHEKK